MTRDHRRKNPITMMPCLNSCGGLLFLGLLVFLSLGTRVTSDPLSYSCPNTATYTPNSIYKANLNTLFSALSSNAAHTNGFYNFTAGANSPDAVYGLFLCRGDVSAAACRDCVVTVSYEITQLCPRQKVAVIWYDNCLLRYSNRNIFSIPDRSASLTMYNVQSIRDPVRFNQLLGVTMDDVATRAANDQSGKKFATKEANFTAFQKLYGLAQCTPDLSSAGCNSCLRDAISAIPSCCNGRRGGRVVFSSCYVRYELYPFYSKAAASLPALVFPPPLSRPRPRPLPLPSPRPRPRPCRTSNPGEEGISSQALIAIIFAIVVFVFAFVTGFPFLAAKGKKKYDALPQEDTCKGVGIEIKTVQSLEYDLATIQAATNNFSDDNKIGEGGFGHVYKGALPSGQKIAVKRLSPNSGQGAEEFQNEVALVARLQHRNLVKLLGFCLEGEEKILIYEIVPNKSLNYFLFDPKKQEKLDWSRRYKIIRGIARGILYLHEDSGFRIIHRDLKASNILLDGDMDAKISDFGMARIFGVDQTRGNTSRVVGTFGYMSPEYAIRGQFSVKSDVFSFGVLVLEIISGKKNSSFYQSDRAEDIPSYAWKLWTTGTPLELMDPSLKGSYSSDEVTRCIHIGLLCVQEDPDARPSMATVVLMLSSFSATLPVPQQPALFARSKTGLNEPKGVESDQSTSKSLQWTLNEASITEQYPR